MRAGIASTTDLATGIADEQFDDPLGPSRGVLTAVLFSIPMWIGVGWAITRIV